MSARTSDEVKESVKELARIYQPSNPRKFVKDFVRKYRIQSGYEEELTHLVLVELGKAE